MGFFERFIAWRYIKFSRNEGFIAVIAWFSFLGIVLGVATLIIVMSVMNGFRHELMNRILGLNGHLMVCHVEGSFSDQPSLRESLRKIEEVCSVSPLIERQGLFMNKGAASGGVIHGMAPLDLQKRSLIAENIVAGNLAEFGKDNTAVIGHKLARKLHLQIGDRMKIMAAEMLPTAFGFLPKTRHFRVVGFFDSGMHEYDNGFIFIPLSDAQQFFDLQDKVTGWEIFVQDPGRLRSLKEKILKILPPDKSLYDWQQANSHFFNAIEVQRNVMFLILTLIVLVAVFNIISCLVMLVKDKTQDIAVLRTMGATRSSILRLFVFIGTLIGSCATLTGAVLGLSFACNIESIRTALEKLTGVELFKAEIYFLSHLPARVEKQEVIWIMSVSLLLSFLATLYPAWKASRLSPVEGLRYG